MVDGWLAGWVDGGWMGGTIVITTGFSGGDAPI